MRVKIHQIRAKVAFTKPLTTHLMRGKGDFSCRDNIQRANQSWPMRQHITDVILPVQEREVDKKLCQMTFN